MPHGCSFSAAEIDGLLDIIEDVLPIGPDDSDTVTEITLPTTLDLDKHARV